MGPLQRPDTEFPVFNTAPATTAPPPQTRPQRPQGPPALDHAPMWPPLAATQRERVLSLRGGWGLTCARDGWPGPAGVLAVLRGVEHGVNCKRGTTAVPPARPPLGTSGSASSGLPFLEEESPTWRLPLTRFGLLLTRLFPLQPHSASLCPSARPPSFPAALGSGWAGNRDEQPSQDPCSGRASGPTPCAGDTV